MITIDVVGDAQIIARLGAFPGRLAAFLQLRFTRLAMQMQATIKQKLSGPVLNVRTGKLRDSIDYRVTGTPSEVQAVVFSNSDVKYGAIHEYGGVIDHPGGTAYFIGADGMAHFMSNAAADLRDGFRRTKPHKIPMPERAFMRPTLAEYRNQITAAAREAVAETL